MESIRSGLKCSTIEAVFATIHMVLTQGIFLTNYVIDQGASNLLCCVVESLPFLTQFGYFLSPILVRRLQARKPVTAVFSILHRISWLALIGLMYVEWPPAIRHALMVFVLFGANVCAVIAANAWFSWMTDLVPTTIRGSYYGLRNTYLGLTSLVALFVGSQLLTQFRSNGMAPLGYTICFGVAIASAAFAAWMLLRQYEPKMMPLPRISARQLIAPLKTKPALRKFIMFYSFWQYSLGVASALFGVHMVRVLHMSPAEMGYQALLASMTALTASRLWGRALDRVGDRAVLITSGTLVALHVWVWIPSHPGFVWPVWIASVLGGIGWSGFNMAVFSWPQRLCGQSERQYAYGLLGFFSGPSFVLGSMTGGLITTFLPQVFFQIGSFEVLHYHATFALSSLGRLAAIILVAHWSLTFDRSTRSIAECLRDTVGAIADEFPWETPRRWLERWGWTPGISQPLGAGKVRGNTGERNRPESECPQAQKASRFRERHGQVGRSFIRVPRKRELEIDNRNHEEHHAIQHQVAS